MDPLVDGRSSEGRSGCVLRNLARLVASDVVIALPGSVELIPWKSVQMPLFDVDSRESDEISER
jgi:hypothetical protein